MKCDVLLVDSFLGRNEGKDVMKIGLGSGLLANRML